MQAIYHIGPNFLCNGHVTRATYFKHMSLIISIFLCDSHVVYNKSVSFLGKLIFVQIRFLWGLKTLWNGYLTTTEFLCDGHVMERLAYSFKLLIFNYFLCNGYVISNLILFDGYLIKATK
jgi:hypothetical protein